MIEKIFGGIIAQFGTPVFFAIVAISALINIFVLLFLWKIKKIRFGDNGEIKDILGKVTDMHEMVSEYYSDKKLADQERKQTLEAAQKFAEFAGLIMVLTEKIENLGKSVDRLYNKL
jgi:hypothetical protein